MPKPVRLDISPKDKKVERIKTRKGFPRPLGNAFFEAKPIDQVVAEQGIKPVTDWSSLGGLWPEEGLDEMLAEIYADRRA